MKKYLIVFSVLLFLLFSACSSSDESEGVVSTNDLSSYKTVTTIVEEFVEELVSVEDSQILIDSCLRES